MLRPYYTCVRRELVRWGGTVEKFIGDAVMAAFGAPVSHEDDAERAVRAALRVVRAVQELNAAEPESRSGPPGGGDHRGSGRDAWCRDGGPRQHRDRRRRHRGGSRPGDRPRRGGGGRRGDASGHPALVDYAALDPASVPIAAGPIRMWRATSVRSAYGSDVSPGGAPRRSSAGSDELALLKATYARATRQASVQLVTVAGEPGVGKSRLVREFRTFVDWQPEHARWRQGRCLPVRRRHHVLGARGDRQEPGGDPGIGQPDTRPPRSFPGHRGHCGGSGGAGLAQDAPVPSGRRERPRRRRAGGAVRVVRRLAALPRGRRRQTGRWSWSSRTCTGPARCCSSSWSTSWTRRPACRAS